MAATVGGKAASASAGGILANYRRLGPYFRAYWGQYAAGFVCLLVIIAGQLIVPQYIRQAIDALVAEGDPRGAVWAAVLGILGATGFVVVARFGWRHYLAVTGRKIEQKFRGQVYGHIQTLSAANFHEHSTGSMIANLTNDLQSVRMACSFGLVSLTDGVVMGGGIIALLLINYPRLSVIILLPLLVVTLLVFIGGRLVIARYKDVQEKYGEITQDLRQSLLGIQEIKALGREDFFTRRFHRRIEGYRDATLGYVRVWSLLFPAVLFFGGISNLLLLYFGGRMVVAGAITIGDFVAVLTYLELLIWPMVGAGFTVNLISQGAAGLQRIGKLMDTRPAIVEKKRALTQVVKKAGALDIHIRDLHYRYPNTTAALFNGITCTFAEGKHIGIIGRTGCGKSTLARLCVRLLEPRARQVFLGGRDIRDYALHTLRRSVCLLAQEPFLFSDSIAGNITFTRQDDQGADDQADGDGSGGSAGAAADNTDKQLLEVLEACGLGGVQAEFTDGLATEIGEHGVMISGGQRQRIALARALLADPSILILDDTLSALDSETAYKVCASLQDIRRKRSTIIVSNKVQAIMHCDRIFVIEDGLISQQGTPQQLTRQKGLFRELWLLQLPTEAGKHGK